MTLLARVAVAACLAAAGSQTNAACNSYDFRPHATLDVGAVRRLTLPSPDAHSTTTTGVQLVIQPFDHEDHPDYGRWRGLAVVYVTRGDLGEDTVGGVLLQARGNPPMDLAGAKVVKDHAGVELRLEAGPKCPTYRLLLRNDGTLIVQGKRIGRLAD